MPDDGPITHKRGYPMAPRAVTLGESEATTLTIEVLDGERTRIVGEPDGITRFGPTAEKQENVSHETPPVGEQNAATISE